MRRRKRREKFGRRIEDYQGVDPVDIVFICSGTGVSMVS